MQTLDAEDTGTRALAGVTGNTVIDSSVPTHGVLTYADVAGNVNLGDHMALTLGVAAAHTASETALNAAYS